MNSHTSSPHSASMAPFLGKAPYVWVLKTQEIDQGLDKIGFLHQQLLLMIVCYYRSRRTPPYLGQFQFRPPTASTKLALSISKLAAPLIPKSLLALAPLWLTKIMPFYTLHYQAALHNGRELIPRLLALSQSMQLTTQPTCPTPANFFVVIPWTRQRMNHSLIFVLRTVGAHPTLELALRAFSPLRFGLIV
jgi:hypothetical protein